MPSDVPIPKEMRGEGAGTRRPVHDFSRPDASGSQERSSESESRHEMQHPLASIIAQFEACHHEKASAPRDQWLNPQQVQHLTSDLLASLPRSPKWKGTGMRDTDASETPALQFSLHEWSLALKKGINLEEYAREMNEVAVWISMTDRVHGEIDDLRFNQQVEYGEAQRQVWNRLTPAEQIQYHREQAGLDEQGGQPQAAYTTQGDTSQQWYGAQEQSPFTFQPDSPSQGKGKAVEYFPETTPVVQSYDDPLHNFNTIGGKTELANAKIILLGESHTPQHHKDIVDFINAHANHGDIILVEGISAGQELSKEEYLRLVARTQRTEPRSLSKDVKIYGWDDASLLHEERNVVTNIKALQKQLENRSTRSSSQKELQGLRNSYHGLLQRRTENMVRSILNVSARLSDGKLFGIAGESHVKRSMMQKDLAGQDYIALTPKYEPTEKEKQDFQVRQESIMRKGTSK